MEEDLLPPPKRGKSLEEVGYKCFDDLASKLFFKQISTSDKSFVMHDLMHDLATSVASELYFRSEELGDANEMSMRTHHLSYERLSHPISKNFDALGRVKSLRTLLRIHFSDPPFRIGSMTFIMLSEFKCLRVLSFASFRDLDVLSDLIGKLIHLRYLDLSKTSIKTLPESLSNLYNLQTLKLIDCNKLTLLPNGMENLVNLRHLDIRGTNFKEMPRGMSKLKYLQNLDYFVVGKRDEENGVMELGGLSNIHGSLSIRKLESVACNSEALKARIMDKTHIETLEFRWSRCGDMVTSISSQIERDILDTLQPHKGLKVLRIEGPDWVGHSSYHNITWICLVSCSNCCMFPSLGQVPSLKFLSISDYDGLDKIGDEFYKSDDDHSPLAAPFPSLEDLEFCGMSSWEVWHSSLSNVFPQLNKLRIYDKSLPCHMNTLLQKLQRLEMRDCPEIELFLDGGLPPNLKSLVLCNCEKLLSGLSSMGLHHGLTYLYINGPCESVKFFPKHGSLPRLPSLTNLDLYGFSSVETLDFKELLHLTSLEVLTVSGCPKLKNMTGESLPTSLIELRIYNSPLLEVQCKMKRPQIWPKISNYHAHVSLVHHVVMRATSVS